MEKNIINEQLEKYEHSHTKDIKTMPAVEIIRILQHLDKDMYPLLEVVVIALKLIPEDRDRGIIVKKILDFYGLGEEVNILKIRQKLDIIKNKIIKRPFLKPKDKENINSLIQDLKIL
jgi:hypothetical protein